MTKFRDLRRVAAVAILVILGFVATGCGDADETPVTDDDTTVPQEDAPAADDDMSDEG